MPVLGAGLSIRHSLRSVWPGTLAWTLPPAAHRHDFETVDWMQEDWMGRQGGSSGSDSDSQEEEDWDEVTQRDERWLRQNETLHWDRQPSARPQAPTGQDRGQCLLLRPRPPPLIPLTVSKPLL